MSTQKDKFALFSRLAEMGFSYEEAAQLRRIQMTLHRWDEQECGDGNDYASWAIERDEATGRPYRCTYPHNGKMTRHPIADREAGAKRRLAAIMERHPDFIAYHQSDCRGCALYLVKRGDIPILTREEWLRSSPVDCSEEAFERAQGRQIESYYTRGLAVSA